MGNSESRPKPSPEGRTLASARTAAGLTRQDLAACLRYKDRSQVAHFENGTRVLTYDHLVEMAAAAGVPPEAVAFLHLGHSLILLGHEGKGAAAGPLDPTAQEEWNILCTATAGAWSMAETLLHALRRGKRAKKVQRELRQAEQAWARLEPVWRQDGRDLVTVDRTLRTPALAARICEASERAAANSVADALDLARFALFVAEHVPDEARRARAVGFCRGFVANALRVAEEIDAADAELAGAREHWEVGDPGEPEILPDWRLHDHEISLRRAQNRFLEALECSERAFVLCGGEPAAAGRILLRKENVLDAMGDIAGALAVLADAAPFVEAAGEPRQLFALRFKMVNNFCGLKRYEEAAELLPGVCAMAAEQDKTLDIVRVRWLSAKVDAGQGRVLDAMTKLEQVCNDFCTQQLPTEAALAALELALHFLGLSRTAEVKQLAVLMGRIFVTKGITEKALAALTLFCAAAKQETATVELTQWVMAEMETARRLATPAPAQEWPKSELA